MKLKIFGTNLLIETGDLAAQDTEALLCPANTFLWMGGEAALGIKAAGGEAIEEAATAQGPIGLGEAISTNAGELATKRVIHVAIVGQDLRATAEHIEKGVANALRLVTEQHLKTLAMPPLGIDPGHMDPRRSADALVGALVSCLMAGSALTEVRIITPDEQIHAAYVERAGARFTMPRRC